MLDKEACVCAVVSTIYRLTDCEFLINIKFLKPTIIHRTDCMLQFTNFLSPSIIAYGLWPQRTICACGRYNRQILILSYQLGFTRIM